MIREQSSLDARAVERFLIHEARLLDERRFEEWMELFTADGYYWAPARPGQPDPWSEASLMFDDREIMLNRIQRLRHPQVFAQLPASRAVRQVANIDIEGTSAAFQRAPSAEAAETDGPSEIEVRSVFFMFEHRPTLPQPIERIFAGHYRHRLRVSDEGLKIAWKKVELVNSDAAFEPLFLYF